MICGWTDNRNNITSNTDIYSAKIGTNGVLIGIVNTNYVTIGNGNWSDAATWAGNMVPPAGANIIINHTVIANINVTCNSLLVQTPGKITVNTGISVTVLK